MKRGYFAAVVAGAVLLAGCATTSHEQIYRPRGSSDAWRITSKLSNVGNTLEVFINGEPALRGSFGMMDWSKEMTGGKYRGHAISASCHKQQKVFSSSVKCDVLVGGERAAHFVFDFGL
mgnify:FL=1